MTDRVLTPLCEIAKKFGTDKGGWHEIAGDTCHRYTEVYHRLFKDRRKQVKNVLEIGVNYGCSLRMWEEYFPNAQIIGIDCNAGSLFNEGRIRCFPADQNNPEQLEGVLNLVGIHKFDLIVDDGSHEPSHQILSARVLLKNVAEGGWYIIEDVYPDCNPIPLPELVKFAKWQILSCGVGIGKAHCGCPEKHEEVLIAYQNVNGVG